MLDVQKLIIKAKCNFVELFKSKPIDIINFFISILILIISSFTLGVIKAILPFDILLILLCDSF